MHSTKWNLPVLAVLLLVASTLVYGQDDGEKSHSTSVAGMVHLLQLEANLIENLSSYADELENKLQIVRG